MPVSTKSAFWAGVMRGERRPLLLLILSGIIGLALIYTGVSLSRLFASSAASHAEPPSSPAWDAARKLAEKLHEDPRFKWVAVRPDDSDQSVLLIVGEVASPADAASLEEFVSTLSGEDRTIRVMVEALSR